MISLTRIKKSSKYAFPFIFVLLIAFIIGSAVLNRPPKADEKGPEPFLDPIGARHIEVRHIDLGSFTAKSKLIEGTDYRSLINETYENCQSFRKESPIHKNFWLHSNLLISRSILACGLVRFHSARKG